MKRTGGHSLPGPHRQLISTCVGHTALMFCPDLRRRSGTLSRAWEAPEVGNCIQDRTDC